VATHDYVIANGTGAAVRSDLNGALAAIVSQNSSATEPSPSYAYQRWADTTAGVMKMRNGANNAWITLYQLDGEWSTIAFENGTAAAPSLYFKDSGTDTGIYSSGADQVAISTGGTGRVFVSSTGLGVGTTPGYKLDVNGEVAFSPNTAGKNTFYFTTNASNDASLFLKSDTTNKVNIQANGTSYFNGGNVGIGVTAPQKELQINATTPTIRLEENSGGSKRLELSVNSSAEAKVFAEQSGSQLLFGTVGTERARIDSSGRLLVGTSTNNVTFNSRLQVKSDNSTANGIVLDHYENDSSGGIVFLAKSRSSTVGTMTVVQNGDTLGQIQFGGADGTQHRQGASIAAVVDAAPGAADMPSRLVFSTTADGAASPTERMRITQGGFVNIGSQGTDIIWNQTSATGITLGTAGVIQAARSNDQLMLLNRIASDGALVSFAQDGTLEGNITVSGTTISYNGAHLSRWTQLPSGAERTEILRGTVLSNIDEMCEWGEEENEQLNRMKVSDVECDKNVAGVFQAWDDDDDTYTDDFYCAMTGDFIIRIAEGITVERGDLLMSAGDGTAKPQDDDIIRSKTIAKVTSTNVSCTYEDGSYCVPCVLMAC
jgi:hypothetical protein